MRKDIGQGWNDVQKLQDWINNLEQENIFIEELEELKEIVNLKKYRKCLILMICFLVSYVQ
jgi:hypothetical protein